MYERLTARAENQAAGEGKSFAPYRADMLAAPGHAVPPQRAHRLANFVDGDEPAIQRVVVRGGGNRQNNVDLVNTVIGFRDFGVTPGRINNEEFPGGNAAQAVIGPQLRATPGANGQTEVRVATEPVNVVDYRMELPTAPPWQRNMAKDQLIPYIGMVAGAGYDARLQTLRDSAKDATAFRVAGAPNDAGFAALVETHENHHVADLWRTSEQILEPWDANIRLLRETAAPIAAQDEPTASQALYATIGGTPAQIGQRILDDMRDKGLAFHQTAQGGPPTVSNVTTATNPNALTLTWRHPLG